MTTYIQVAGMTNAELAAAIEARTGGVQPAAHFLGMTPSAWWTQKREGLQRYTRRSIQAHLLLPDTVFSRVVAARKAESDAAQAAAGEA